MRASWKNCWDGDGGDGGTSRIPHLETCTTGRFRKVYDKCLIIVCVLAR